MCEEVWGGYQPQLWCYDIIFTPQVTLTYQIWGQLGPCNSIRVQLYFPTFDLSQTWNFHFLKWIIIFKMLRRYDFYRGIRRPPTPPYPSKLFGPRVTMALFAAPPPWYPLPPFAENFRGWDEFVLSSPRPSLSNWLEPDLNFNFHPNSHGQNYPKLAFTPEIFSHRAGSPSLFASSRKTLKTSLFSHSHTINSPKLLNEATQSVHNQQKPSWRKKFTVTSPNGASG